MVGVYAPEEGRKKNLMQEVIDNVNKNDFLVITSNLNVRIGNLPVPGITIIIENM